MTSSRLKVVCA